MFQRLLANTPSPVGPSKGDKAALTELYKTPQPMRRSRRSGSKVPSRLKSLNLQKVVGSPD